MGGGETANPIFTEFTTAKAIWLGVIVVFTAFVMIRGLRRRRLERDRSDGQDSGGGT